MYDAVMSEAESADVVFMTAAVADWTPVDPYDKKVKKSGASQTVKFKRTPDILAALGALPTGERPFLVGWAAETGDPIPAAREKRIRKNVDLIVANDVSREGCGFGTQTNVVTFVDESGETTLPMQSKSAIADLLMGRVSERLGLKT